MRSLRQELGTDEVGLRRPRGAGPWRDGQSRLPPCRPRPDSSGTARNGAAPDCAKRRIAGRRCLVAAAAVLSALLATSGSASAATSATNTATVHVATTTVSITVTPATSAFGDCYLAGQLTPAPDPSELTIPNGLCNIGGSYEAPPSSGGVTVTNGGTADQIDVNGGAALPSDMGTSWALTGQYSLPGADQFAEYEADQNASEGYAVPPSPQCDMTFGTQSQPSCDATPDQSEAEDLWIVGPSSSTDQSAQFTITTTWTAVSVAP